MRNFRDLNRTSYVQHEMKQNRIIDRIYNKLKAGLNIQVRREVVAHIWSKHGCRKNAQKWSGNFDKRIPSYFFNEYQLVKAIIEATSLLSEEWIQQFPNQIYVFASFEEPIGRSVVNISRTMSVLCMSSFVLVILNRHQGLVTAYPI
ncbi:hypothetical protein T02_10085 [Trichinella nativa]|uniref:Uncharacterized protein n=1 Tax=Trichinella nativa TaxID=6335 RepID=A0A0V1L3Z3_9BILA|nr:hypothetical protein T06_6350 [Trichinella sp. T6]KRZ53758.1 hypothetical protein T02_10085 [Trichinella nativa]OUC41735.1 hypothetical protein D917_10721 [Trichinella nativa]